MKPRRGAPALLAGLVPVAAGYLWVAAFPTPDANIGAGQLTLAGWAVAAVGVVLLVTALVLGRRRRPSGGPAGSSR